VALPAREEIFARREEAEYSCYRGVCQKLFDDHEPAGSHRNVARASRPWTDEAETKKPMGKMPMLRRMATREGFATAGILRPPIRTAASG
jgi:hypothetical protein